MKTLEPKDELLIQNKIDGSLSAGEEIWFDKLIENSPQARKFYEDLLILQKAMESDSKSIPSVDFTEEIVPAVKSKQKPPKPEMSTSQFWIFLTNANFMAYAAILLVGLVIGSLVTNRGIPSGQMPDERQFSGTISALPALNFDYNQDGTQIKVQELLTPKVKITTVYIHTELPVQCKISGTSPAITDKNILLQFADGQFLPMETGNEMLQYSCSGWIVFQIKASSESSSSRNLSIEFAKNNMIIKQVNLH